MITSALARVGVGVALLLMTACAGDAEEASATTVEAEAHEFAFEPSEWTAAAATDVSVSLSNTGEIDHEWVIIKAGQDISSEDEFAEELVEFEVEAVPPGETGEGTFNLPAETYQIICALDGHFSAGMEGELTLE